MKIYYVQYTEGKDSPTAGEYFLTPSLSRLMKYLSLNYFEWNIIDIRYSGTVFDIVDGDIVNRIL